MQILSTRSLKILYETKVQAERLYHPGNPDKNENKNENKEWDSARLNIWLTQKDESALISLYLKTKLILFSFNLNGALWTSEASKDIPVSLGNNHRAYLDFKEDFIYVRRYWGESKCCIIMDTQ
jgi:hypothetical protein